MKIQFIGTGSIGAKERSACTLINDEVLIDLGNGNVKTIKQNDNDILKIKALFITHLHGDHYADIPFFILDRTILNKKIEKDCTIYGPKGLEENVKLIFETFFRKYEKNRDLARIKFEEIEEKHIEKVFDYEVIPYLVDHGAISPAYGYIIKKDGKSIGFSGDSVYCKAIDEIIENSDVAILDSSYKKAHVGHMGLDNIIELCEKYPEKKIITTHMQLETREVAKNLNIDNLIIPNDGDIFEI